LAMKKARKDRPKSLAQRDSNLSLLGKWGN
jgi:hypothetical protein